MRARSVLSCLVLLLICLAETVVPASAVTQAAADPSPDDAAGRTTTMLEPSGAGVTSASRSA